MRLKPGVNGFRMSYPCFHRDSYDVRTSHGLGSWEFCLLCLDSNKSPTDMAGGVKLMRWRSLKLEAPGNLITGDLTV